MATCVMPHLHIKSSSRLPCVVGANPQPNSCFGAYSTYRYTHSKARFHPLISLAPASLPLYIPHHPTPRPTFGAFVHPQHHLSSTSHPPTLWIQSRRPDVTLVPKGSTGIATFAFYIAASFFSSPAAIVITSLLIAHPSLNFHFLTFFVPSIFKLRSILFILSAIPSSSRRESFRTQLGHHHTIGSF
ncbi:hypothetical protein BZA77DRAFT_143301 [Pyronema omphalodes]|nr:hypothetical protein BZA77DRAFT_143301 [Pyronema omphalodes]